MEKLYINKDVYTAAQERIRFVFDNFDTVCVSFSGGKDSGVVLNMAIDEARARGRMIHVVFIDLEAFYQLTIDFIRRMIDNNRDVVIPHWICLPMESDNSSSFIEPTWKWWDPSKEPLWVRPMPKADYVIDLSNHQFDFYHEDITFEKFVEYIGDWIGQGGKTACMLGIRATESLNRYRSMVRADKTMYEDLHWSTQVRNETFNFFPIYDWTVEDIWTYNGRFGKDYNHLYDMFHKAGLTLSQMRVDEPFGDTAKGGLNMFRVIEPSTWARVCNRVSGANFGCIYAKEKINKSSYTLPDGHTWESFTKFLLDTLPEHIADHYRSLFDRFTRYWLDVGCPESEKSIAILESRCGDSIVNTHEYSNRGKGDKHVIRFTRIVDSLPELDGKEDILTWKRMAMCIIKNDYYGRTLSFSIPKRQQDMVSQLKDRYRRIMKGEDHV